MFSDDNKKYLSTDLLREEPVRPGYLTPEVGFETFRAWKRTCQTCCDPAECCEGLSLEKAPVGHPIPHCPRKLSRPVMSPV